MAAPISGCFRLLDFGDFIFHLHEYRCFGEHLVNAMLPVIVNLLRPYATYLMWPAAAVIGVIGYNIEHFIRGDPDMTFRKESVGETRDARLLQESAEKDPLAVGKLKDRAFVPKTIFREETSPVKSQ